MLNNDIVDYRSSITTSTTLQHTTIIFKWGTLMNFVNFSFYHRSVYLSIHNGFIVNHELLFHVSYQKIIITHHSIIIIRILPPLKWLWPETTCTPVCLPLIYVYIIWCCIREHHQITCRKRFVDYTRNVFKICLQLPWPGWSCYLVTTMIQTRLISWPLFLSVVIMIPGHHFPIPQLNDTNDI